jgi:serine/threonine protein kinase
MASVEPVALKFCLDPAAAKVLRNEAGVLDRVMRQGRHAGIVQLLRTYLSAETPCLEYEYVDGGDLTGLIQEWHRAKGGPTPQQAAKVVLRLAEVVGFAHRLNPPIVHHDLKPANILVQRTADGEAHVKVTDFGIGGVAVGQAIRETSRGTSRGRFLTSALHGSYTPLYASPQQMRGEPPDPRDDVYSLGVIWYQLLTGELATGRPGGARWRKKLAEQGMPSEMAELLECCFEDNPDDRPLDAKVMADTLSSSLKFPPPTTSVDRPITSSSPLPRSSEKVGEIRAGLSKEVLVIPARQAWEFYKQHHVYLCPSGRAFQPVKYIAFYSGNEIRPLVPKILEEPPDPVIVERGKYHGRLGEVVNEMLNRYEKGTLPAGWDLRPGRHLKVFLLSAPEAADTIILSQPIINDLTSKNGQRIAFTQNRRYVPLEALRKATKTSELGEE